MGTVSIVAVTPQMIRDRVAAATRNGVDADAVAEFLAAVDWTGYEAAPAAVRDALGQLEAWATEFAEGELTEADYRARLRDLLVTGSTAR